MVATSQRTESINHLELQNLHRRQVEVLLLICSGGVVQLVFLAVFFRVGVDSFGCVLCGMGGVALRHGGMVCGHVMLSSFMMGRCLLVVFCCVAGVLSGLPMMGRCFFGHNAPQEREFRFRESR